MSTDSPLPAGHPMMRAWKAHTETPEYANSLHWAQYQHFAEGSLWALFVAGWQAAKADSASVPPVLAPTAEPAELPTPATPSLQALAENFREYLYRTSAQVPFEHAQWAQERGAALLAALKALGDAQGNAGA